MVQIVVVTKQTIIHASCLAKQPPIHLWRRILANNNGQWPVKRCRQSRYCRFFLSIPLLSTWRGGKGWNPQVGSRQQIPSRPRKPRWAQLGRCSNYRSTGLTDSTCGLVGRDSQGRQTQRGGWPPSLFEQNHILRRFFSAFFVSARPGPALKGLPRV